MLTAGVNDELTVIPVKVLAVPAQPFKYGVTVIEPVAVPAVTVTDVVVLALGITQPVPVTDQV